VKPYLQGMTRSEVMSLMTVGMSTIATGVMVVYPTLGMNAGHILTASVLGAPAGLLIAKIMIPEVERSETASSRTRSIERTDVNSLDALCRGTSEGVTMAINVMGMLIAFVAVVALFNACLGGVQTWFGVAPENVVSLQKVLGWANAPFAWLMGVSPEYCTTVGQTLGERVVLNEFIGYLSLSQHQPFNLQAYGALSICAQVGGGAPHLAYYVLGHQPTVLDYRSFTIATYALCGFANFSSIAIQIGGIGSLAADRRHDLAKLGMRAMIAGLLACYLMAAIVGILL
jgi:concentrative nucleoside transporter, CNT family